MENGKEREIILATVDIKVEQFACNNSDKLFGLDTSVYLHTYYFAFNSLANKIKHI